MAQNSQLIETEQSVLGAALYDADAVNVLLTTLAPNDFSVPRHTEIYKAIACCANEGLGVDQVTVAGKLRGCGINEKVVSHAYLAELVTITPTAANVGYYARQVRQASARRKFEQELSNGVGALREGVALTTVREMIDRAMLQATEGPETGPQHISVGLSEILRMYDQAHQNRGTLPGLSTGFKNLDRLTGGMHRSDLIIIGARPSVGKTALLLNIANHVASTGKAALIFSLEMSLGQLTERIVASTTQIDGAAARIGGLREEDFGRIVAEAEHIHSLPLMVDDTGGISMADLRARARRAHRKHGVDLIAVDYLQLMKGERNESRALEVGSISRGLKALAKELNIPVIALSQLNRGVELRTSKVPTLADLRDSGEIEQDADLILFLHRQAMYDPTVAPDLAELIVAKHRRGPCCTLPLHFNARSTRFWE